MHFWTMLLTEVAIRICSRRVEIAG
jgi:hypothetical protein